MITAPPASATASEGQSVKFTVGVTGNGPLNFEWKRNGQLVAITTIPSYTTPALTIAGDNGAVYTVDISNAGHGNERTGGTDRGRGHRRYGW